MMRSSAFRLLDAGHQDSLVEMNVLYNDWIVEEADRYGVPAIASQPWPTLPARFVAAVHEETG